MKKLLCIMLLAGAALSLPAKVTLAQAVANAWAIDPALDSQKLEEEAAAIAGETALRQKYFSVQFGAGYRYSSDKVQVRDVRLSLFPGNLRPAGNDHPLGAQRHHRPEALAAAAPLQRRPAEQRREDGGGALGRGKGLDAPEAHRAGRPGQGFLFHPPALQPQARRAEFPPRAPGPAPAEGDPPLRRGAGEALGPAGDASQVRRSAAEPAGHRAADRLRGRPVQEPQRLRPRGDRFPARSGCR